MPGTGEAGCNNNPRRHTDSTFSHFTVFPPFLSKNNGVLQQKIRNENSETKLMKYDMNEWSGCFALNMQKLTVLEITEKPGDKTSEHLYPPSLTKTHSLPVFPCPQNVQNVWKPGEKSRKISALCRSLNPISLHEGQARQLQTVEVTKIFSRKSGVTRHIWKLKLT